MMNKDLTTVADAINRMYRRSKDVTLAYRLFTLVKGGEDMPELLALTVTAFEDRFNTLIHYDA